MKRSHLDELAETLRFHVNPNARQVIVSGDREVARVLGGLLGVPWRTSEHVPTNRAQLVTMAPDRTKPRKRRA